MEKGLVFAPAYLVDETTGLLDTTRTWMTSSRKKPSSSYFSNAVSPPAPKKKTLLEQLNERYLSELEQQCAQLDEEEENYYYDEYKYNNASVADSITHSSP